MKFIILLVSLITMLNSGSIIHPSEGAAFPDESKTEFTSSSKAGQGDVYASSLSILKNISPLSSLTTQRGIFIIGKVALSRAEKNLANLSEEAQRSMRITPVMLYKYESQNPPLFGDTKPDLDRNLDSSEEEYLELAPYIQPTFEAAKGLNESRGGVTAIWIP